MVANPYLQYQKTTIDTATPERLLIQLYDGLIRFLHQAEQAIDANASAQAHNHLVRAQDILVELMSTLNMDAGPIAQQLMLLYDYAHRRLVEANLRKDGVQVAEVRGLMETLRDGWVQAALQLRQQQGVAAAAQPSPVVQPAAGASPRMGTLG